MALSEDKLEKLREKAREQEQREKEDINSLIPAEPADEKPHRHIGRIILIVLLILLIVGAGVIFILYQTDYGEDETDESENVETDYLAEADLSAFDNSDNIIITGNEQAEETEEPEPEEPEESTPITILLPNSLTGFTSKEEARLGLAPYSITLDTWTEQESICSLSDSRRESILNTISETIQQILWDLENTDEISSALATDDFMRTAITLASDQSDAYMQQTASQIVGAAQLYGYFSGYRYINPCVNFYSPDGELLKIISIGE